MSVAASPVDYGADGASMKRKYNTSACNESPNGHFYSDKLQVLSHGSDSDISLSPDVNTSPIQPGAMPAMLNRANGFPKNFTIDPKDLQLTNDILYSIRQKIHDRAEHSYDMHYFQPKQELEEQPSPDSVEFEEQEELDDLMNLIPKSEYQSTESSEAESPTFIFPHTPRGSTDLSYMNNECMSSNKCCAMSSVYPSGDQGSPGNEFTFSAIGNSGLAPCSGIDSRCDSAATSPVEKSLFRPSTSSSHLLPPCRVCGDKASGFHYGANTCEACKGFFRRSLKKDKREYKCAGEENCIIQKGRRNNCTMCRYIKCLAVGMSKDAIKTGRYTHEKRTKDILEVKTLQGKPSPLFLQPTFSKSDRFTKSIHKRSLSDQNKKLLDKIFSAHKLIFPIYHSTLATGLHKQLSKQYAEKYKLAKIAQVNSPGSTGTQSDNSNSPAMKEEKDFTAAIDNITSHLEIAIMAFVRYAKAVPGFTDLPLNDQATLVKLSRFEVWMVSAHKLIDVDLQVVTGPRNKSYHMDELCEILDDGYVRSLFNFAQSMQDINLTLEETAMLKCIVLTFSDRGEIEESSKVEDIQLMLVRCLEQMIDNGVRFAKVMNSLIRLRDLTEWNNRIAENMVLEWPTLRNNPLLVEIMSI